MLREYSQTEGFFPPGQRLSPVRPCPGRRPTAETSGYGSRPDPGGDRRRVSRAGLSTLACGCPPGPGNHAFRRARGGPGRHRAVHPWRPAPFDGGRHCGPGFPGHRARPGSSPKRARALRRGRRALCRDVGGQRRAAEHRPPCRARSLFPDGLRNSPEPSRVAELLCLIEPPLRPPQVDPPGARFPGVDDVLRQLPRCEVGRWVRW